MAEVDWCDYRTKGAPKTHQNSTRTVLFKHQIGTKRVPKTHCTNAYSFAYSPSDSALSLINIRITESLERRCFFASRSSSL